MSKAKSSEGELTSKLTEPFLFVSKASNRKCAYILESAKISSYPRRHMKHILCTVWIISLLNIDHI